jgi:hypothetical protein
MMKKRGIYIAAGGAAMVVVSFAIAMSVVQDHAFEQGEFSIPEMLEGMFDEVTEQTQIMPGETASFSFDAVGDTRVLLWGMQIMDYQSGDTTTVSISNIFGDKFGEFKVDQPAFFETTMIEKSDIYNFNVENNGNRPITIVMMFTKNPNDSTFSDPNSPLSKTLVPLAVSGTLFILGLITIIAGAVIIVIDYRKRRSEFV